jgi:hypothetical protein
MVLVSCELALILLINVGLPAELANPIAEIF